METKKRKKPGRPVIEIDDEQFRQLCEHQCTKVEIAAFFKCSDDTIENYCKKRYKKMFSEVFAEFRQGGFVSLRNAAWTAATKRYDAKMLDKLMNKYLDDFKEDSNQNINITFSGEDELED